MSIDWTAIDRLVRAYGQDAAPEAMDALDEVSLWSAPFGLSLLAWVRLARGLRALDVGCGAGFPLLELADRLGPSCEAWGLDPWRPALERARRKLRVHGAGNVRLSQGRAEEMPFPAGVFDLVVSNNGLNNVADIPRSLSECRRVCRRGAQFLMTANLPDTFRVFYECFDALLRDERLEDRRAALREHIRRKRPAEEAWRAWVTSAGFRIVRTHEDAFAWSFLDGEALFGHWLIRFAFLPPWREVLPQERAAALMLELQRRVDQRAREAGGLHLEVPYLLLEAEAA